MYHLGGGHSQWHISEGGGGVGNGAQNPCSVIQAKYINSLKVVKNINFKTLNVA